jgi:predicted house-cleaning noncanonical NTP pyrophosphatase (MazG superfamily)
MRTFNYGKLVRDKIPGHMLEQGEIADVRTLSKEEYRRELIKKIGEEVLELEATKDNSIVEIADIREALDCLRDLDGMYEEDIAWERFRKNTQSGSFSKRQFVGKVALPENNIWIEYLEAHPDRYPEIIE